MEWCWYCVNVRHFRHQDLTFFFNFNLNCQRTEIWFLLFLFVCLFVLIKPNTNVLFFVTFSQHFGVFWDWSISVLCFWSHSNNRFNHNLFSSLQSPFNGINHSSQPVLLNANVNLAFRIFRSYQSSTVFCSHSCEVASFFLFVNLTTHLQSILGLQVSEEGWFKLWLRLHKQLLTPLWFRKDPFLPP